MKEILDSMWEVLTYAYNFGNIEKVPELAQLFLEVLPELTDETQFLQILACTIKTEEDFIRGVAEKRDLV